MRTKSIFLIILLTSSLLCGCGYNQYLRDDLGSDVKKSASKTGCQYELTEIPDDFDIGCGDGTMTPVINFSDDGGTFYCKIVMDMTHTNRNDRKMYVAWLEDNNGFDVKINNKNMDEVKFDDGSGYINHEYITYICSIDSNGKVYDGGDSVITIKAPQDDTYKKGNDNIRRIDTYRFKLKNIETNKNDLYIEDLESELDIDEE